MGKLDTVPAEHDGAKAVSQSAGAYSGVLGVGGYSRKQAPIKSLQNSPHTNKKPPKIFLDI